MLIVLLHFARYLSVSCLFLLAAAEGTAAIITRIPALTGVMTGSIIVTGTGNEDLYIVVTPSPGNILLDSKIKGTDNKIFTFTFETGLVIKRIVHPDNPENKRLLRKFVQHSLPPRLLAGVF